MFTAANAGRYQKLFLIFDNLLGSFIGQDFQTGIDASIDRNGTKLREVTERLIKEYLEIIKEHKLLEKEKTKT